MEFGNESSRNPLSLATLEDSVQLAFPQNSYKTAAASGKTVVDALFGLLGASDVSQGSGNETAGPRAAKKKKTVNMQNHVLWTS